MKSQTRPISGGNSDGSSAAVMTSLREVGLDLDLESMRVLLSFESTGLALGRGAKSLSSSEGSDGNAVGTAAPADEKSNENDSPLATGAEDCAAVHTALLSGALFTPDTATAATTDVSTGEGPDAPPRRFALTIARARAVPPNLRRPQREQPKPVSQTSHPSRLDSDCPGERSH
jgi:hypothetical protein